jgi:hypothetical protein
MAWDQLKGWADQSRKEILGIFFLYIDSWMMDRWQMIDKWYMIDIQIDWLIKEGVFLRDFFLILSQKKNK